MYDGVKRYMDVSQRRSQLVVDRLGAYIDDPNQRPNDRIMTQFERFFNGTEMTIIKAVRDRYAKITQRDVKKATTIDRKRVDKALSPSLLDHIKHGFPDLWNFTPMDIFETPELTMLHELTHLLATANTHDRGGYGWVKCIKAKTHHNADSLAYFALVVDLIENYGCDADEQGTLSRIT
ncbi:hypothetical protein PG984_008894 [Apiospora sp. TS-2023a]